MNSLLIKKISEVFFTESRLCYDNLLTKTEEWFITAQPMVLSDSQLSLFWEDVLKDKRWVLERIECWYENDEIFNYLLPAILIDCLDSGFSESMVQLCLEERLQRDYFGFGVCRYGSSLSLLTVEQRDAFGQFLEVAKANASNYVESYLPAYEVIEWLGRRDKLVDEIKCSFPKEQTFSAEEIADFQDRDGRYLCEKLVNITWPELLADKEKFDFIIDDYIHLYDEPYCYFMPACIIASLYDIWGGYYARKGMFFYEYTISNLCGKSCYLRSRNKRFTSEQRVIVVNFLKLIHEITDDGDILDAIDEYAMGS